MRDQESFVDNARWRKNGGKSGVFFMYQFSNFNNVFFLTLVDHTYFVQNWHFVRKLLLDTDGVSSRSSWKENEKKYLLVIC